MNIADLSIWIALGAGLISFLSPCVLPLYPVYLSYITGISVKEIETANTTAIRIKVLLHTTFFLLGISTLYFTLAYGASTVGNFFYQYQDLVQQISGVLIVLVGLFLLGVFKLEWLMRERRLQITTKPAGYLGSALIGMGFAAGWTPCIGPILSVILFMASTEPSKAFAYMSAYLAGFALPFYVFSFFIATTRRFLKYTNVLMKIGGVILIIMGILLYFDLFAKLTGYILYLIQDTWLGRLG
jgi:cytochrome c-type biogenesis protein